MNVLAITILVSLCLRVTFRICFVMEAKRPNKRSPEQDSLIPFQDNSETPEKFPDEKS